MIKVPASVYRAIAAAAIIEGIDWWMDRGRVRTVGTSPQTVLQVLAHRQVEAGDIAGRTFRMTSRRGQIAYAQRHWGILRADAVLLIDAGDGHMGWRHRAVRDLMARELCQGERLARLIPPPRPRPRRRQRSLFQRLAR